MFAAAVATDSSVQQEFINRVHAYASSSQGNFPFPVLLNTNNASQIVNSTDNGGINRYAASFLLLVAILRFLYIQYGSRGNVRAISSEVRKTMLYKENFLN